MKKIIYDLSQVLAALLISAGAWGQWGWTFGFMVFGVLVLALSLAELILFQRGR